MKNDLKPEPDHGITEVWSTEDAKKGPLFLQQCGGDVRVALKKLFGGSTSYQQAVVLAKRFAADFGLTEGQFLYRYYAWRRNEL